MYNFEECIWIIDVYKILSDDIDFDKLGKLIIKYNLVKMWSIFLNISRDLFGRIPGNADILDEKKYHSLKRHRIINKDSLLRGVLPYSLLINIETGFYFRLNEVGNFIWPLLDGKQSAK